MPQSVLIVIPAYNEKLTIGSVVVLSKKYCMTSDFEMDNGSSSQSFQKRRYAP